LRFRPLYLSFRSSDLAPVTQHRPDPDPLDEFELPPDVMSATFEHAISDDASVAHERGHAVAAALQKALKGSTVEYGFPGIVTAHLASGAVARCGGPALGWMIDLERRPGRVDTIEVDIPDDETSPPAIAAVLAKALKRR
jgi:hypothetical protein